MPHLLYDWLEGRVVDPELLVGLTIDVEVSEGGKLLGVSFVVPNNVKEIEDAEPAT